MLCMHRVSCGPDEVTRGEATAHLVKDGEHIPKREDSIGKHETANIAMMLNSKLSNTIRPVTELSEKSWQFNWETGTVKQWVSDLEDVTAANTLRVEGQDFPAEETAGPSGKFWKSKPTPECLSWRVEGRSRAVDSLKNGSQRCWLYKWTESWWTDHTALDLRQTSVLVRLHKYPVKQRILYAARDKGMIKKEAGKVSYQDFPTKS